jgi:Ca-activated chloride channel family protein
MNTMTHASALCTVDGEPVALRDVAIEAVLQDLLAEVTVAQTYRNGEARPIEAVYTFPLPSDAVLLGLHVEIGDRRLAGQVVERKAAEARYEEAVEDGDAAVMLQLLEPGLYTMNVGNLLAGETARITLRYAMLHRWSGSSLRMLLPTTVAPRYGQSPYLPHLAPDTSITVENEFSLRVRVQGLLCGALIECPSHAVDLSRTEDHAEVSLRQARAPMDRDFILNLTAPQAARSFALSGQDVEGVTVLAGFQPVFPSERPSRPLSLALVVDCSGSMNGDSIIQARQAIAGMLDRLRPDDRITLVAFGHQQRVFSESLVACTSSGLARARRFARSLEADMGGTEIGAALERSCAVLGTQDGGDIFLVTDGEVSNWQGIVARMKQSGHRVFTVGVGHAVSEAFLRALAEETGGACELVSPNEQMAERMVRHFERLREPPVRQARVRWPEGAVDLSPAKIGAIFEGDTLIACARFPRLPEQGRVTLEIETDEGQVLREELAFPVTTAPAEDAPASTIARVAAARRLPDLSEPAGPETALRYQLISPWTHWLVIAERPDAEKSTDLPALRKVPNTLAAGWGGTGAAASHASMAMACADIPTVFRMRKPAADTATVHEPGIPAFLRAIKDAVLPPAKAPTAASIEEPRDHLPVPYQRLLRRLERGGIATTDPLELLTRCGFTQEFDSLLARARSLGLEPDAVATLILARLLAAWPAGSLPDAVAAQIGSLRRQADKVAESLRGVADDARRLLKTLHGSPVSDALKDRSALGDRLQQLALLEDLLREVEHTVRTSAGAVREAADPQVRCE